MFKEFQEQKFGLIYADPAWQFNSKKSGGSMKSGAAQHYDTMSVDELKAMPVDSIAADNCILVMWYVGAMPEEAIEVVKAWGFTLKNMNGFMWNKLTKNGLPFFGMGYWTRSGSESAIIATKGKPKVASRSVRAVGNCELNGDELFKAINYSGNYPVLEHSRKPNEFRVKCEELAGDAPKVELFARTSKHGWSVWGNETTKFDAKGEAA
ncbi:MT-A70 family methyltransferase [Pseudoalteromonas luteoviolacea]|uniref:MT-A70 family methyltransferase n=1 Tax=Pseudoalteromonas luteoviolacea TaxID=43657 RepID=UPI001F38FAB0|nr:MT-A70 family methyltransferase [Pseudoalteromonas luteoviolacea]MCF6442065.1 MT-A70 family methyltransferase [Pseudoalteromonas luteoviolacea]